MTEIKVALITEPGIYTYVASTSRLIMTKVDTAPVIGDNWIILTRLGPLDTWILVYEDTNLGVITLDAYASAAIKELYESGVELGKDKERLLKALDQCNDGINQLVNELNFLKQLRQY